MTKPSSDLTTELAKLAQVREQLQEEIREARGTLKDLRREIREARELIPLLTDERFEEQIRLQMDVLGEQTKRAMDQSVAKVTREFDKLRDVLMGQDSKSRREGRESIPTLVRQAAALGIEADRE